MLPDQTSPERIDGDVLELLVVLLDVVRGEELLVLVALVVALAAVLVGQIRMLLSHQTVL